MTAADLAAAGFTASNDDVDVVVMAPQQKELAAIKKRLAAHWRNITSILPNPSEDVVLKQVNVIARVCADRIPLWKRVKLFDTAAAAIYKAAAALAQALREIGS